MKSLNLNARTSLLVCDRGNDLFSASAEALSCRWTMHMKLNCIFHIINKESIHVISNTTSIKIILIH